MNVEEIIKRWLEEWIIGHQLCPFAKGPYQEGRVQVTDKTCSAPQEVLSITLSECEELLDHARRDIETTLLVFSKIRVDVLRWNKIVNSVQQRIEESELCGKVQVVMFHPNFHFGDSDPDDITNVINRSPFPIIHILREESISEIIERGVDTAGITSKNSAHLETLGWQGWKKIMTRVLKIEAE